MTKSESNFRGHPAGHANSVFPDCEGGSPVLISVAEFCRSMSIGRTLAYSLINSGEVDVCRIGRRTLIKVDSVMRLVTARSLTNRQPEGGL